MSCNRAFLTATVPLLTTTNVCGVLNSELLIASARAGFMYRIIPGGH